MEKWGNGEVLRPNLRSLRMMMCFEKSACSVDNSDPVPVAPSCMPCMFPRMFKWCVSEDPACIFSY